MRIFEDSLMIGACPGGEIGRRKGLKILFAARRVRVQVPPRAPRQPSLIQQFMGRPLLLRSGCGLNSRLKYCENKKILRIATSSVAVPPDRVMAVSLAHQ